MIFDFPKSRGKIGVKGFAFKNYGFFLLRGGRTNKLSKAEFRIPLCCYTPL